MMQAAVISVSALDEEAGRRAAEGWRFVTATCVPLADGNLDLLYHFDKDLVMEQVRVTVPRGAELPSLCPHHAGAYLVENEMQDQFGLRFAGLAPDFRGGLLLEPEKRLSPLAAYAVASPKDVKPTAKPDAGDNDTPDAEPDAEPDTVPDGDAPKEGN